MFIVTLLWTIVKKVNTMFFSCSSADSQIKPVLALQRNGMAAIPKRVSFVTMKMKKMREKTH